MLDGVCASSPLIKWSIGSAGGLSQFKINKVLDAIFDQFLMSLIYEFVPFVTIGKAVPMRFVRFSYFTFCPTCANVAFKMSPSHQWNIWFYSFAYFIYNGGIVKSWKGYLFLYTINYQILKIFQFRLD